jgi:hypothetical protein
MQLTWQISSCQVPVVLLAYLPTPMVRQHLQERDNFGRCLVFRATIAWLEQSSSDIAPNQCRT